MMLNALDAAQVVTFVALARELPPDGPKGCEAQSSRCNAATKKKAKLLNEPSRVYFFAAAGLRINNNN